MIESRIRSTARRSAIGAFSVALLSALPALAQGPGEAQPWPPLVAPTGFMEPGPGWPPRVVEVTRPLPGRPFSRGFVDVDGYHIQYVDNGKKGVPVLISIPGSGGLELSSAKDILAKDYRVIELNPPGWGPDNVLFGDREMKDMHGNFDMKDMSLVFLHALDKLGIVKFHLWGTSVGCNHAMWMVERAPERVLSFTAESGECFSRPQDKRDETPRARAAEALARKGTWTDDYAVWSGFPAYQWAPNKWWQTPAFQARLMRRRYMKILPRNEHKAEMTAAAKDVKVPVTAMVGDRDELTKISVGEAWKAAMPQVRFVVIPSGTHDLQNSQPEQFVQVIKACSIERPASGLVCPGD